MARASGAQPARRHPSNSWSEGRLRSEEGWRLLTNLLELKSERESYLVARSLWQVIPEEIFPVTLVPAIDRQGVFFLWPLRMPGDRANAWHTSAWKAAELATKNWVRIQANMHSGSYEVFEAVGDLGEPDWPEVSFQQAISIAFKDHFIDRPDHPVLRRLRGEL